MAAESFRTDSFLGNSNPVAFDGEAPSGIAPMYSKVLMFVVRDRKTHKKQKQKTTKFYSASPDDEQSPAGKRD